MDLFKVHVIGRQIDAEKNMIFLVVANSWMLLNVFRAMIAGWALQIQADVTCRASSSALNKLGLAINSLEGACQPWSFSLIPHGAESAGAYGEAVKATSVAAVKLLRLPVCECPACPMCTHLEEIREHPTIKAYLVSPMALEYRIPFDCALGDNSHAWKNCALNVLRLRSGVCQTHLTGVWSPLRAYIHTL